MAAKKQSQTTAVTKWEEKMAESAKKQAKAVKPVGNFKSISFKGGMFVDEKRLKDDQIRCIVLVGCHENAYYPNAYQPDVVTVPVCYAFSEADGDDDSMAPHEKCKDKQCETCGDCELNVMGSADVGRGKACKNLYRLLIITEDALESPEAMDEAEVRSVKLPVTSVKNWSKYMHSLADDLCRPSYGVITTMSRHNHDKFQFEVKFAFEELINFDGDMYEAIEKKIAAASREINTPYPDVEEAPAKPARKPLKGTPAAKAAPAKRTAAKR